MSFIDILIGLAIKHLKEKMLTAPLSEKEIRIIKKDIANLMEEGEKIEQGGQYINARKLYIDALKLEKILLSPSSESLGLIKRKLESVEVKINEKELNQITIILDNGDNFMNTEKHEEALNEYEKAFEIFNKMLIFDTETRNTLFNSIVLRQIKTLIDKGVKLKSDGLVDNSTSLFEYALNLTEKMFPSKQKRAIIKKIEKNLDIYSEMIREKVKLGKILMEQNRFEESINHFQMAKELIKKKYELLENTISNRVREVNETREIDSLVDQSKLKRIENENIPPI
jgi:tetratricopeptide (TPR) repeat protein